MRLIVYDNGKEKYFDKYKNKKMYAKIRVALGVCFSIFLCEYHSILCLEREEIIRK